MIPESIQRCRNYYYKAEAGLKEYTDWRVSDWVAGVDCQIKAGKKKSDARIQHDKWGRSTVENRGCTR